MERFDGRLSALASAHNLLVKSHWRGAELGALAREQLGPYITRSITRVRIEGRALTLPPDLATPFGLVLHELATNAAKYGSLSNEKGTVELTWRTTSGNAQRLLTVEWRECGGPPVTKPEATGLGSLLIESGLPNATVRREFNPEGVVCTIELPVPEAAEHEVGQ